MKELGNFIYHWKKVVIVLWILLILTFGFFALKLPSVLSGNGFEYDGMYMKTKNILEEDFKQGKSTIILLFERDKGISDYKWKEFIENSFSRINDVKNVHERISPFQNEQMMKEHLAYGILTFDNSIGDMDATVEILRKKLTNQKGLQVSLTGEPVIVKDLNEASQKDLAKAEMIGLPIALLVLVLSFGGLIAASIPMLIGIISIVTTMGIVYFFGFYVNLSIFILNIVPMIGLALSIDFALLFINRFKEEIQKKPVKEAVTITVLTAGRSIIFSGLCVFIGLLGLLFIKIDIFWNVAIGGMTVVFISVLSAITFLPAILSILGNRINAFSVFKQKQKQKRASVWNMFAQFVMERPILMTTIALTLLIIALIPVKDMRLTIPDTDSLPPTYESRIAFEKFEDAFTVEGRKKDQKITVIVQANDDILTDRNLEQVNALINDIQNDKHVTLVESPFSLTGVKSAKELSLLIDNEKTKKTLTPILNQYVSDDKMLIDIYLDSNKHAKDWARAWEKKDTELDLFLGGQPKFEQEIFDEIYERTPYGLVAVLLSTFVILMIAFRSLLIPLKAIIMNMLSLAATFGLVVWIFQEGHLGMDPVNIGLILPVFVFSLVFGLSMDYEVFLISRIHEKYQETRNNDEATLEGLTSTSKIITSAAAIMIVVTGAFAFTGVMPIKQMGVGIAIAIFIDATIIRMILVPALMKLLGDWNWWFFGLNKKEKKMG